VFSVPIDWVAFKIDDATFGIYDTLEGQEDQNAHLEVKLHQLFASDNN